MNILPFVLGFILLFAVGVDFLFHKEASLRVFKKGAEGHFRGVYRAERKKASHDFKNKEGSNEKEEESLSLSFEANHSSSKSKNSSHKAEKIFRDKKPTQEQQKFNLALLKPDSPYAAQLRGAALELIKKMYEKTPFYREGIEQDILQAVIEEMDQDLLFSLKNPELDALFYQMQRGTSTYDIKTQKGFPSFWDYFTVCPGSKLNFLHLPKETLESILGKPFAEKVFEKERDKRKSLTLKELKELLNHEPGFRSILPDAQAFFRFSEEKSKDKDSSIDDQESGLLIRNQ